MKIKFSYIIQNVNNILHYSNILFFIYGTYNYKYFTEQKQKKFFHTSLKNGGVILVDAINHININKLYYLIPSIFAKLLTIGYYYKLFGYEMKQEIFNYLNLNATHSLDKFNNNLKQKQGRIEIVEINEDDLNDKDKIEYEIIEDKITRITHLYDLNRKSKFSDIKRDDLAIILDNYEGEHKLILNAAVLITLISPFI